MNIKNEYLKKTICDDIVLSVEGCWMYTNKLVSYLIMIKVTVNLGTFTGRQTLKSYDGQSNITRVD